MPLGGTMVSDIRWHQRFSNFQMALKELMDAVNLSKKRDLSKLEEQGLIQSFEYNYELAWNCLKDICEEQGVMDIIGSKDAIRYAFKRGLIVHGELWMDMIKSRINTSHTYNKILAHEISKKIINDYYPEFIALQEALIKLKNKI